MTPDERWRRREEQRRADAKVDEARAAALDIADDVAQMFVPEESEIAWVTYAGGPTPVRVGDCVTALNGTWTVVAVDRSIATITRPRNNINPISEEEKERIIAALQRYVEDAHKR